MKIPFVKVPIVGSEKEYLNQAFDSGHHDGNGIFTKKCQDLLENQFNIGKTLLTTSGTDALEMAAMLLDSSPGDEFILPSYTFSSTATAFIREKMIPVFCDIRKDTLNIDETKIEELITDRTRAIVVVHYAGVCAEMDTINQIAMKHNIIVIEDAAQAVNSKYNNRYAGSLAELSCFSFHKTKSYSCGEGGALGMNKENYYLRSEYLWEKGTDRSLVIQGLKNKYWWVDEGSSFLPSDLLAAILYAQLEKKEESQLKRKHLYLSYQNALLRFVKYGLSIPHIPEHCESNYHAFWILLPNSKKREQFIEKCLSRNISVYIGYIPLHNAPKGEKLGGLKYNLPVTRNISNRVVRLPFYLMEENEIEYTISNITEILEELIC